MREHVIPPCPKCGGGFVTYLGHTPLGDVSLRCVHCKHGWVEGDVSFPPYGTTCFAAEEGA